jgi:DNA-binding NarL/FixJ family response regulator
MNNPQVILMVVAAACGVAVVCCAVCLALALKARSSAIRNVAVALELEADLMRVKREIEELSQRNEAQACRIAWLESRARSGPARPEPTEGQEPADPNRTSITERRHRVLTLARRGVDVNSIAATLGVPHGEVELIIGLNSAA